MCAVLSVTLSSCCAHSIHSVLAILVLKHVWLFCLHVYVVYHMCSWGPLRPKEGFAPPPDWYWQSQMVVDCHMGAENQTRFL